MSDQSFVKSFNYVSFFTRKEQLISSFSLNAKTFVDMDSGVNDHIERIITEKQTSIISFFMYFLSFLIFLLILFLIFCLLLIFLSTKETRVILRNHRNTNDDISFIGGGVCCFILWGGKKIPMSVHKFRRLHTAPKSASHDAIETID